MEPFITTFSGRKVNPLRLRPEDVSIEDIAHHLALQNRFLGATRHPVTIAQHSVYVSRLLYGTIWEREGLFHDAPEAYLGDVTKWLKAHPSMQPYRDAEDRAWKVICQALDLNPEGEPGACPMVEQADRLMVRFEAFRMVPDPSHMFGLQTHPMPTDAEIMKVGAWGPWTWRESKLGFLDHARMLGYPV